MEYLTLEQLEQLREFDTPTIYNAINAFGVRSKMAGFGAPGLLKLAGPEKPMVGYCVTCRVDSREPMTKDQQGLRMAYYETIANCPAPSVAVVEDMTQGSITTFWGEVQAMTHRALGAVGTLVEGTVRDVPAVSQQGFYFFAKGTAVASGNIHVVDYDCPVRIRGVEIRPGDLVHADVHGFVVIPPELAPKLAQVCRRMEQAERPVLDGCRAAIAAGRKPTMEELAAWRQEMARLRAEAAM